MKLTFEELYRRVLEEYRSEGTVNLKGYEYDENQLDCLLNPEKYPPVWRTGDCGCEEADAPCRKACQFDAIGRDEAGNAVILPGKCVGCSACVEACERENIKASVDLLPVAKALREGKQVYAMIAPAFLGQYTSEVTPGRLRSAFKAAGFAGMLEVALFADLLTLKEGLEFVKHIKNKGDYLLTSCCCPMWIAMLKRVYSQLMTHVPGSVSPMIASGRTVKLLHPDALTVFVGPCVAKKAEAREPDLAGAVDHVLTFREMKDLFDACGIDPAAMEESTRDHSSRAGRIYARVGGVSEAVRTTVERIRPQPDIEIVTRAGDGIPACKAMLNDLVAGKIDANFYEGMGCVGGCVGGPKVLIDKAEGKKNVDAYGDDALYPTPIDNPYVVELLKRLGFETTESLLEDSEIFTRKL